MVTRAFTLLLHCASVRVSLFCPGYVSSVCLDCSGILKSAIETKTND
jgi:hypothetical protein